MPSITYLLYTDTFATWRVKTNDIIDEVDKKLNLNLNLSDLSDVNLAQQNLLLEPGVNIAIFIKNNYGGLVAPTITDDSSSGYSEGSLWVDTVADEAHRCVDDSVGAAVWLNTTTEIGDLGSIATQDANDVNITGGNITGITDLAISDGGTGASDASGARTNFDVYSKAETNEQIIAMTIALGP
jgi:hypothetical protein